MSKQIKCSSIQIYRHALGVSTPPSLLPAQKGRSVFQRVSQYKSVSQSVRCVHTLEIFYSHGFLPRNVLPESRTHTHTHTHIHTHIYKYIYNYIYIYIFIYTHTHTHIYIYIYMCVCVCVFVFFFSIFLFSLFFYFVFYHFSALCASSPPDSFISPR